MKKAHLIQSGLVALVACLGIATGAHAASTWQFSSSSTATKTGDATDPTLTGIAGVWAANGGTFDVNATNGGVSGKNYYGISGFANGATWNAGTVGYSGGSGLTMSSDGGNSPNHAFDNGPRTSNGVFTALGNTEALLLSFSSSIVLTGINVGWTGTSPNNDTDVSLFRYTGAIAPSLPGTGASLASMVAAGWEHVSNESNLVVDTMDSVNSANKASSWWLVSAYNQSYGSNWTQGNDFMKIYAVAGRAPSLPPPNGAPEPASLALVAVGLLGILGMRRRAAGSAKR